MNKSVALSVFIGFCLMIVFLTECGVTPRHLETLEKRIDALEKGEVQHGSKQVE